MQSVAKSRLFAPAFGLIAAAILLTELRTNSVAVVSAPRSPAVHSTGLSMTPLWVDLNHDGRLDSVVLVSEGQSGTIKVGLTGVGERELKCSASRCSGAVYAADVDHDNNLDLVQESADGVPSGVVWLGDGKGNFALAVPEGPLAVDFYTLPPTPFRPSPSRQSGSTSWFSSTAAQKRERSRILKPAASDKLAVVTESRRRRLRQDTPAPVLRELLAWRARTINAPPPLSLVA